VAELRQRPPVVALPAAAWIPAGDRGGVPGAEHSAGSPGGREGFRPGRPDRARKRRTPNPFLNLSNFGNYPAARRALRLRPSARIFAEPPRARPQRTRRHFVNTTETGWDAASSTSKVAAPWARPDRDLDRSDAGRPGGSDPPPGRRGAFYQKLETKNDMKRFPPPGQMGMSAATDPPGVPRGRGSRCGLDTVCGALLPELGEGAARRGRFTRVCASIARLRRSYPGRAPGTSGGWSPKLRLPCEGRPFPAYGAGRRPPSGGCNAPPPSRQESRLVAGLVLVIRPTRTRSGDCGVHGSGGRAGGIEDLPAGGAGSAFSASRGCRWASASMGFSLRAAGRRPCLGFRTEVGDGLPESSPAQSFAEVPRGDGSAGRSLRFPSPRRP